MIIKDPLFEEEQISSDKTKVAEVKDSIEFTEAGKNSTQTSPDRVISIEKLRSKYGIKTSTQKSKSSDSTNTNVRVVLDTADRSGKITLAFVPPKAYVPDSWAKLQSEDLSKMNEDEKKVYN